MFLIGTTTAKPQERVGSTISNHFSSAIWWARGNISYLINSLWPLSRALIQRWICSLLLVRSQWFSRWLRKVCGNVPFLLCVIPFAILVRMIGLNFILMFSRSSKEPHLIEY